jgi:hypothetical protein
MVSRHMLLGIDKYDLFGRAAIGVVGSVVCSLPLNLTRKQCHRSPVEAQICIQITPLSQTLSHTHTHTLSVHALSDIIMEKMEFEHLICLRLGMSVGTQYGWLWV